MNDTDLENLFVFFRENQSIGPEDPLFDSKFCQLLCRASSAAEASIWILGKNNRLFLKYGTNFTPEDINPFALRFGEGITGAAALSRKAIKVSDAWSEARHSRRVDTMIDFRTHSMISAPILYNGVLYGVLNILNCTAGAEFPDEWNHLLSMTAVLYGAALVLKKKSEGQELSIPKKRVENKQETVIVGISRSIQDVLDLAVKAGRSEVPVLIYGETGVGKELVARRIHENTDNAAGPFLSINCAALSETILESELFGHVKGAFSGAIAARQGKFVAASGGTLFLDEISEMSQACQVKVLRAIQEKTVVPVGSDKEVRYDARIIAATNKQLHELVKSGKFRNDLYYRLCGLEMCMPKLCERKSDIPLLIDYFIRKSHKGHGPFQGSEQYPKFSSEALDILMSYSWPGNVRQLEQAVSASLTLCDGKTVTVSDLPAWLEYPITAERGKDPDLQKKDSGESCQSDKKAYTKALDKTRYPGTGRWNVSAAARLLDIPRKTFEYRMRKMNLT
jgi:transcriptional regulator with PAS, ATPase and Fis domain